MWSEPIGFGTCPPPPSCNNPPPLLTGSTNNHAIGPNYVGTVVEYACDADPSVTRISTCVAEDTWTAIPYECPVYVGQGNTFKPTKAKPEAYIISHNGYPNQAYLPWLKRNWFFETFKGCYPIVTFIGPVFEVKGKQKCGEDQVIIQQYRSKKKIWKVEKCGVYFNPKAIGATKAKWDDKTMKIHFRTNKPTGPSGEGKGFKALVTYKHCYGF